jgi:hypothetical protein
MSITAMLLSGDYPAMAQPPKHIVRINRCLSERPEPPKTAAEFPPRVRLPKMENIARGEAVRRMILDGIKKHNVATIADLLDYVAKNKNPMSITNARKHLNKLVAAGKVERTDDCPGQKKAVLYWLKEAV